MGLASFPRCNDIICICWTITASTEQNFNFLWFIWGINRKSDMGTNTGQETRKMVD